MRAKFEFIEPKNSKIVVPLHYNYLLQHLIYNVFSDELRLKLYFEGFSFESRRFKLFTFSKILEKGKPFKNYLVFDSSISFYFSSAFNEVVSDFSINAIKGKYFHLGGNNLILTSIEILDEPKIDNELYIKVLSPITVYSTFEKSGKKITHYFRPDEDEFQRILEENARKKYAAALNVLGYNLSKEDLSKLNLRIEPYRYSNKKNKHLIYFKNTVVEAYSGIYKLQGSRELIEITYDVGLGSKNSEGFGMWEPWNNVHEVNYD